MFLCFTKKVQKHEDRLMLNYYFFFQNNSNVREESEAFVWRCRETNDNLFIRKKQDWENSVHISLFMTFFQAVLIYTILVYFFIFIFFTSLAMQRMRGKCLRCVFALLDLSERWKLADPSTQCGNSKHNNKNKMSLIWVWISMYKQPI